MLSPFRRQLIGKGAWVAAGQVLTAVGTLAGIRLLTEVVAPPVFGQVSLLLGMTTLAASVFCGPFVRAVLRFYAEAPDDQRHVAELRQVTNRSLVRTSTPLVLGILALTPWAGHLGLGTAWVLPCLAGLLVTEVIVTREVSFLSAAQRQRPMAMLPAAQTWARYGLAAAGATWLGAATVWVLAGYLVGSALTLGAYYLMVRREGAGPDVAAGGSPISGARPAGTETLGRRVWRYALPLVPLAAVSWITSLADRYILAGLLDLQSVGLYSAAHGLANRSFLMIHALVERTLRPLYFNAVAAGNRRLARRTYVAWLTATLGLGLIALAGFALLADLVVRLLLAEVYTQAAGLLPWLALGHLFLIVSYVVYGRLYALQRTGWILATRSVAAALTLVLALWLTWWLGLVGAAVACSAYYFVELVLAAVVSFRTVAPGDGGGPSGTRAAATKP